MDTDNTRPTWLTKWGHMLKATPEGPERTGPAPPKNLGANPDGDPAKELIPLNDLRAEGTVAPQQQTGVINLRHKRMKQ